MAHYLVYVVGDHAEDQLSIYDKKINPAGKWDWYIFGGKWAGFLKLKHGAKGEFGKPALKKILLGDPLPYGDLSADIAMKGDIDWHGMRQALASVAQRDWDSYVSLLQEGDPHAALQYGIEPNMTEDEYISVRSHPVPFAILENSDWHQRGTMGPQAVLLDATPASAWNAYAQSILDRASPDTLITVTDVHL